MKARTINIAIVSVISLVLLGACARMQKISKLKTEAGRAESVPHARVHFPFDNDEVFLKDIDLIDANADWLKRNREAVVILEGHCDEHGPSDYNMELGDKRARTIKSHLVQRGVPHEKIIMVVSYGEARPTDLDHTFDAWKRNRRVEFILR
jgi:peptidoglycan-associated lipoprotein